MGQETSEKEPEKKFDERIPKDNWIGFYTGIGIALLCLLALFLIDPEKNPNRPYGMFKVLGVLSLIGSITSMVLGCMESEKRRVANEPVVSYQKLSEYDGWEVLSGPDMTYSVVGLLGSGKSVKLHIDEQVAKFMLTIPKIGEGRRQFFYLKNFVVWLEEKNGKARNLPELIERAEQLTHGAPS
ncbi:MAG: hypothetical protein G01um101419_6 [Parcubacteria group bacterium Gr01-1014_19]|nr:MAG: hypothetical protein G01um101419_6 [Parcubacteria group bacterium Gr01-1014_19]